MSFVPQHFAKFGSSADDLINKKLEDDGKHTLIVNAQSKNITATHTVNTVRKDEATSLEAKMALKYEDKAWGESTTEFQTSGKIINNLRLTKVAPNTTITVRTNIGARLANYGVSPAIQYRQEFFAGSVEYNNDKNLAIVGLVGGYEGFSVGAQATCNTQKITDEKEKANAMAYNFGVQYEDRNVTVAAAVDGENSINASVYYKLNDDTQFALKGVTTVNNSYSANFAATHTLSPNTSLKGKLHVAASGDYKMASHVQQKLASPNVIVGVTTVVDSTKKAPIFGLTATFDA